MKNAEAIKRDHSQDNVSVTLSLMAKKYPAKPALLHPECITFRELEDEVNRTAHGLVKAGIIRKTRTVLLVSPGPEFSVLIFALLRVGAVPVMIDPGMGLVTLYY